MLSPPPARLARDEFSGREAVEGRGGAGHRLPDGLSRPWNYDKENWATAQDGIGQVGCIHTSQGLEFHWLGVLIGPDLIYRDGKIIGDPARRAKSDKTLHGWKKPYREAKKDPLAQAAVLDKVQAIIKSTYKVLLSRGSKGCYVWCADAPLREYLRERLALATSSASAANAP